MSYGAQTRSNKGSDIQIDCRSLQLGSVNLLGTRVKSRLVIGYGWYIFQISLKVNGILLLAGSFCHFETISLEESRS